MKNHGAVESRRPELEQRGRRGEQQPDRQHEGDAGPARERRRAPCEQVGREGTAQQRGPEGRRARDAHVPLLAGRAHERRERTLRVDARRAEVPWIRSELGQRDRHQREQHARERPRPRAGSRAAPSRGSDAVGGGDPDHEPRERVLEEAAVEERVHEQADEASLRARARAARPSAATCRISTRPPTSSHAYSARPITPSSANTVSGVVCETKFGVGPLAVRPAAGWRAAALRSPRPPPGASRSRARRPPRGWSGRS